MPLSRLPLPSFSLVITGANGEALLTLEDFNPAGANIEVGLQFPQLGAIVTAPTLLQPGGHDPLMQTVDTRFQGQLTYSAHFATDAGKPNVENDGDEESETGTVFESSPVGPVYRYELQPLGETGRARRPRRRPNRGRFPGLLRRLNMKFSMLWRRVCCLGAAILCRSV